MPRHELLDEERLLTVAEVAEYLGVSPKTLYTWKRRGTGPRIIEFSRHLRVHPDDLKAWVDELRAAA